MRMFEKLKNIFSKKTVETPITQTPPPPPPRIDVATGKITKWTTNPLAQNRPEFLEEGPTDTEGNPVPGSAHCQTTYACLKLFDDAWWRITEINVGGFASVTWKERITRHISTKNVYTRGTRSTKAINRPGAINDIKTWVTSQSAFVSATIVSVGVSLVIHPITSPFAILTFLSLVAFISIKKQLISIGISGVAHKIKTFNRANRDWRNITGDERVNEALSQETKQWADKWKFNSYDAFQRLFVHTQELFENTLFQSHYRLYKEEINERKTKQDPNIKKIFPYTENELIKSYDKDFKISCENIILSRYFHFKYLDNIARMENYLFVLSDTCTLLTTKLKALELFNFKYAEIVAELAWQGISSFNHKTTCKKHCYEYKPSYKESIETGETDKKGVLSRPPFERRWVTKLTSLTPPDIIRLTNERAPILKTLGEKKLIEYALMPGYTSSDSKSFLVKIRQQIIATEIQNEFSKLHVDFESIQSKKLLKILEEDSKEPSPYYNSETKEPWFFKYLEKLAELNGKVIVEKKIDFIDNETVREEISPTERNVLLEKKRLSFFYAKARESFSKKDFSLSADTIKKISIALKRSLIRIKPTQTQVQQNIADNLILLPLGELNTIFPNVTRLPNLKPITAVDTIFPNMSYGALTGTVEFIRSFFYDYETMIKNQFSDRQGGLNPNSTTVPSNKTIASGYNSRLKEILQKHNTKETMELIEKHTLLIRNLKDYDKHDNPIVDPEGEELVNRINPLKEIFLNKNAVSYGILMKSAIDNLKECTNFLDTMGVKEKDLIGETPSLNIEISAKSCLDIYNVAKDFVIFQNHMEHAYANLMALTLLINSFAKMYGMFGNAGKKVEADLRARIERDITYLTAQRGGHAACDKDICYQNLQVPK